MPVTIPQWIPQVPPDDVLNDQADIRQSVLNSTGEGDPIPVCVGKGQLGAKLAAFDYDETTETYTAALLWCLGEIEAIDNLWINGEAPVSGVTVTHYTGTRTQGIDATLAAAISGFTDTYVITDENGTRGLAYTVVQFTSNEYDNWPEFVAEVRGLKLFDSREGAHVESRRYSLASPSSDSVTADISSESATVTGMRWSRNGKYLYTSDHPNGVDQWEAGTPFDLRSISHLHHYAHTPTIHALDISNDGRYLLTLDASTNQVSRMELTVPWMINAITATTTSGTMTNVNYRGMAWHYTGLYCYFCSANSKIEVYELTTAWDVSEITGAADQEWTNTHNTDGLDISADGLTILTAATSGTIQQITLASAHSLTSPTVADTYASGLLARDIEISPGGSKMWLPVSSGSDTLHTFTLDTAPDTWEYSQNPGVIARAFCADPFLGPGDGVVDSGFESMADDNDTNVTTEPRRQLDWTIKDRKTWESVLKQLEAYAGGWFFKRGTQWVAALDRPRSSDFTVTTDDIIANSFEWFTAPQPPTHVRVWYTDETEVVWRQRYVDAVLPGVDDGTVERISQQIRLPGVHRSTQANREAHERLNKLQRTLQARFMLRDSFIGIETGDMITLTHPSGFNASTMRVLEQPKQKRVGRPVVHCVVYDVGDYDDTESSTSFSGETRFVNNNDDIKNKFLPIVTVLPDPFFARSKAEPGNVYEVNSFFNWGGNQPADGWDLVAGGSEDGTAIAEATANASAAVDLKSNTYIPASNGDKIAIEIRVQRDGTVSESFVVGFDQYDEDQTLIASSEVTTSYTPSTWGDGSWRTERTVLTVDEATAAYVRVFLRRESGSSVGTIEVSKLIATIETIDNKTITNSTWNGGTIDGATLTNETILNSVLAQATGLVIDDYVTIKFRAGTGANHTYFGITSDNIFITEDSANATLDTWSGNTVIGGGDTGELMTTALSNANTILGGDACDVMTTGSGNVSIGRFSGNVNVTGNDNVFVGENADSNGTGISGMVVLGNNISGTTANRVHIGNGTNHIHADFNSGAGWSYTSDERLKDIVGDSPLGLSFIEAIEPKVFTWKRVNQWPEALQPRQRVRRTRVRDPFTKELSDVETELPPVELDERQHHALIAQNVKGALDDAGVSEFDGWSEDDKGKQSVSLEAFIPPMINAIKEISRRLKDLEQQRQ